MDKLIHSASWLANPLFLAGVVIVVGFAVTRFAFRGRRVGQFVCHLTFFIALTVALVFADVVPYAPTPSQNGAAKFFIISLYKIVWWVAACRLMAGFIRAFMILETQPKETRLLQDLLAGLIYLGGFFAIVANVFDVAVGGLIATSGAIAIILGLALQSTLGDVFSGIVLNLAKPYRPGDWVIFDSETQGTVVEMNWRATQIITASNDLAILPNSTIAKAKLINLGHPSKAHGTSIRVGIEPTVPPSTICGVLDAALLSSNQILHTPRPSVTIKALNATSTECELYFFVPDIARTSDAENELFDLVHRHCAARGLRLAPPPGSPVMPAAKSLEPEAEETPQSLLDQLAIFATLKADERISLAGKMRRRSFAAGETIVEAGAAMPGLFILAAGVLVASLEEAGREVEVVRLGPGECFGERSVLTGAVARTKIAALTSATLYQISKDDLAPLLKARPAIANELGRILARHDATLSQRLEEHADPVEARGDLADWLAGRVRTLFRLTS